MAYYRVWLIKNVPRETWCDKKQTGVPRETKIK